jgi:hypothetical protein
MMNVYYVEKSVELRRRSDGSEYLAYTAIASEVEEEHIRISPQNRDRYVFREIPTNRAGAVGGQLCCASKEIALAYAENLIV